MTDERKALVRAALEARQVRSQAEDAARHAEDALRSYDAKVYRDAHCAANVLDIWSLRPCSRAPGFGKDGRYCKQHAKAYPGAAS